VADGVIAGLNAQAMARCLALPTEPQRLCVVLMDVAGYTAPAEALGCPRGTVLARVHRGRHRLAQLLAGAGLVMDGLDRHDRAAGRVPGRGLGPRRGAAVG
jgi:RNA polymerase sigma-70 factor (ECF subfamily)